MDIDLQVLPIPDWGLRCPGCDYPLQGLSRHCCPECGRSLKIEQLIRTWTRLRDPWFSGLEDPLPDFGLTCKSCDGPLCGARKGQCSACDSPIDVDKLVPGEEWFTLGPAIAADLPEPLIESILSAEHVPYMTREHRNALAVGSLRILVPREFYFDTCFVLTRARALVRRPNLHSTNIAWDCDHCGQRNPGHFDICWACGASRNADRR